MNQVDSLYHQPGFPSEHFHQQSFHPTSGPSYPGIPSTQASSPFAGTPSRFQQHQQSQHAHPQQRQQQQQQYPAQSRQITKSNSDSPHNVYTSARGAMTPSALQQQRSDLPNNAYTSAGYAQSIPTTSAPPLGLNSHAQPSMPSNRFSQSPTKQDQPHAAQKSAMVPPSVLGAAQHLQSPRQASMQSSQPQSPQAAVASQAREQQRVSLLLAINARLLGQVNVLQAQGKGGALNPGQLELYRKQGVAAKMASDEYLQTLYRLKENLGYLCSKQEPNKAESKSAHPPNFMRPPPGMSDLEDQYAALRDLFPGWTGRDMDNYNDRTNGHGRA